MKRLFANKLSYELADEAVYDGELRDSTGTSATVLITKTLRGKEQKQTNIKPEIVSIKRTLVWNFWEGRRKYLKNGCLFR